MKVSHGITYGAALILGAITLDAAAATEAVFDDPPQLQAFPSHDPITTMVVAVPEPSGFALVAAAGLIAARRPRKRP